MIDYTFALSEFEKIILILMRIASFVMVAPFFGMPNTPRRTKVGFSVFLTLIVYSYTADSSYTYNGILEYATLVVKECVVGLLIGYMANMCMQILHFAGRIIDMDIGLAMANVIDPTSKQQVGLIGTYYYDFVMLMLIVSDLHIFLVRALIETYEIIPIGEMTVNASLYDTVVGYIGDYFAIGFRITLPVFAAILLLNVLLAIVVRVAPQINMFVIGMQLKILIGLAVIFLTIGLLPSISNVIYEQMKTLITHVVEGMRNYG